MCFGKLPIAAFCLPELRGRTSATPRPRRPTGTHTSGRSSLRQILPDTDQDGVPDEQDHCPGTSLGMIVDANGCSIEQRVPCAGPWNNHGQYLKAVRAVADEFLHNGLVTESQRDTILSQAVRSDCGK